MNDPKEKPSGSKAPAFVPDLLEHGAPRRGQSQTLDRRLFMQLHVFTDFRLEGGNVIILDTVSEHVDRGLQVVLYQNMNDPFGIGVLVMSEDPDTLRVESRNMFNKAPFPDLTPVPDFTMFGRTYSAGREADLEDFLLHKPRRNALNPDHPWAIWYPLRRSGAFNRLEKAEQGRMLVEHAMIGRAYGEAGAATDIRLECHGLDRDDNEFVLGIIGSELYPLSKLIKDMRSTRQTSEFIEKMGPFFVGQVLYQSPVLVAQLSQQR